MSISAKRAIFTIALALGVLWTCLCLTEVIPFRRWPLSFTIVAGGSLFTLLPLAFPIFFQRDEKSARMAELGRKERLLAGVTIVLAVAWVAAILACIIRPL